MRGPGTRSLGRWLRRTRSCSLIGECPAKVSLARREQEPARFSLARERRRRQRQRLHRRRMGRPRQRRKERHRRHRRMGRDGEVARELERELVLIVDISCDVPATAALLGLLAAWDQYRSRVNDHIILGQNALVVRIVVGALSSTSSQNRRTTSPRHCSFSGHGQCGHLIRLARRLRQRSIGRAGLPM